MRDHRVDISRRDEETETGATELLEGFAGFIIWLSEKRNAIALRLENTGYYCCSEARMVNVCVAADIDKIGAIPAATLHIGARDR